jgi:hypothetical protein
MRVFFCSTQSNYNTILYTRVVYARLKRYYIIVLATFWLKCTAQSYYTPLVLFLIL